MRVIVRAVPPRHGRLGGRAVEHSVTVMPPAAAVLLTPIPRAAAEGALVAALAYDVGLVEAAQ